MRKILDIRLLDTVEVVVSSDYNPLKGLNLYQRAFVSLLFEQSIVEVRKWMSVIRILSLAELSTCNRAELSLCMFENTLDEVVQTCARFRGSFGGNLNFKLSAV